MFAESDSDDEMSTPMILQEPIVVLAAHNGRNVFDQWYCIDTLDVSRAMIQYSCVKLQCLCKEMLSTK